MRVVVSGGAGFIGSHVAEALIAAGHEVVIIDDLSSGRAENIPEGADFRRISITDPALTGLLAEVGPTAVVHHAAQIDVRRSMVDPALDAEINIRGTINLIRAAAAAGAGRFVFASTGGAIYGDGATVPTAEGAVPEPASAYGISKLAGEHYLRVLGEAHGIRGVALRYTNVYGPRQDPHGEAGVVAIFSERLLEGRPTTIFGDGEQTRDYVYVGDVARANLLALESTHPGPVNIGTGVETSVNRLHQLLAAASECDLLPTYAPGRPGEQQRSAVDNRRARDVFGWEPLTQLEDGLAATVAFFRSRLAVRP